MNTKLTALTLAAATAFAFTPKPAIAGDKEAAIVGGLLGGLILGAAIADHNDCDTRVVVASHTYRSPDRCDDGYWQRVETRVWIPGYWVTECRHGRTRRYYVEGHYEIRTKRVWVACERHDCRRSHGRDYDRYDRDHCR